MHIYQIKRKAQDFQQPVNEQALIKTLKKELCHEKLTEVTELAAGMFNNTYKVSTAENAYILKVAPSPDADVFYNERSLMQREESVAKTLTSSSSLVPKYLSFFAIGDRPAFLQPFVQGRLWHDSYASLSDLENTLLWQQLGRFAKNLHSFNGNQFGYPAPFKGFAKWSAFITDNVQGMVEDSKRLGVFGQEIQTYLKYLPLFSESLDQLEVPKLLHGDLWPRNVIFDGVGEAVHIEAVIDAERAFWGDPASDWVLILYGVPEAFWQGYGENLLETRDPACITLYKGMYFILNILEAVRFQASDSEPRNNLAAVNKSLEMFLRTT